MDKTNSKRGPGRPQVDRSDKLMQTFEISIPLKKRLVKLAKNKDITVSKLIREILEKFFEDREII